MNVPPYVELLPAFALCALDLTLAALVHRVVVRDAELVRRRQFFESLAVIAFLVALLLVMTSLLLWRSHPAFVLLCSALWAAFCITLFAFSRLRHRTDRNGDRLELPEMWAAVSDPASPARPPAPAPTAFSGDPLGALPAPSPDDPSPRLKRRLRKRSTESGADTDRRLRGNLAVHREGTLRPVPGRASGGAAQGPTAKRALGDARERELNRRRAIRRRLRPLPVPLS